MKYVNATDKALELGTEFSVFDADLGGSRILKGKTRKGQVQLTDALLENALYNHDANAELPPHNIPKQFTSPSNVLSLALPDFVIRIVNLPINLTKDNLSQKMADRLGLSDEHRFSFTRLESTASGGEVDFLVVALPNDIYEKYYEKLHNMCPRLVMFQNAHVNAIKAFSEAVIPKHKQDSVVLFNGEADSTSISIFSKGALVLVESFDLGINHIIAQLEKSFELESELNYSLLAEENFDISESVQSVMNPLINNLLMSRGFVEKKTGLKPEKVYFSGGISRYTYLNVTLSKLMGLSSATWNPFDVVGVDSSKIKEVVQSEAACYSAAVGAVLNYIT